MCALCRLGGRGGLNPCARPFASRGSTQSVCEVSLAYCQPTCVLSPGRKRSQFGGIPLGRNRASVVGVCRHLLQTRRSGMTLTRAGELLQPSPILLRHPPNVGTRDQCAIRETTYRDSRIGFPVARSPNRLTKSEGEAHFDPPKLRVPIEELLP